MPQFDPHQEAIRARQVDNGCEVLRSVAICKCRRICRPSWGVDIRTGGMHARHPNELPRQPTRRAYRAWIRACVPPSSPGPRQLANIQARN